MGGVVVRCRGTRQRELFVPIGRKAGLVVNRYLVRVEPGLGGEEMRLACVAGYRRGNGR